MELKEVNQDSFPDNLFILDAPESPSPFIFSEGRLWVTEAAQQAIAEGKEKEQFRLFLDKSPMEIEKEAKLFLVHQVRYEGKGREGGSAHYYIFSRYPAHVDLPVYEKPEETLHLGINSSISETTQIRLIPAQALTLSEKEPGQIEVVFSGKKSVLLAEGELLLSRLRHATSVTQELFAPVPKGDVQKEDFRVMTEEYGKVDFSTELSIKNAGLHEISLQKKASPPQEK